MSDLDRYVERAFTDIAGYGVRISIRFVKEDRTVVWPFDVPLSGTRLLEMHAASEARVSFDFPEGTEERQTAWPEDCPYTESEVRAKITEAVEEIRDFERRMKELMASLPEVKNAGAYTIYEALYDAVWQLAGNQDLDFDSFQEHIAVELAETPVTLRRSWLRGELPNDLWCLPSEGQESEGDPPGG